MHVLEEEKNLILKEKNTKKNFNIFRKYCEKEAVLSRLYGIYLF